MKILVIRFSSIGDIVLTTPVVRALKIQLDDAIIHYCAKPQYCLLLEDNPYLDLIFPFSDTKAFYRTLKNQQYDFVVDLQRNFMSYKISRKLNVTRCSFPKLNFEKWLIVNLKINQLPNLHIVDRYMEAVRKLGVKKDSQGLDYFIPEKDKIEDDWLPESHQKEFVVFAIGARHNTKILPQGKMIELCDKINMPIILVGDSHDQELGDKIASFFNTSEESKVYDESLKKLNKKTVIYNAAGKYNINQTASIIKKSKYVFTHDSGLMHIAAALKKEVFTIWGNTIPLFGMYPYKTKFTIFENNQISCRPCSKLGFKKCPKGHFKCMEDIKFDFYLQ